MHKYFVSLALLVLSLALGAASASAQSITTLGTADTTTVTFTTGMGTTGVAVAATNGPAGFPKGPDLATVTSWSLAPGTLTITPNLTGNGAYMVSGTLNFTLKDASSSTVLTGTLNFPTADLALKTSGDLFTLNANLTITGGSICTSKPSACGSSANNSVQLTVLLSDDHHTGMFGSGNATIGKSSQLVTPEPTSMLLFGTGLLAFGGILRRKLLA
jgi:hypothetical protein